LLIVSQNLNSSGVRLDSAVDNGNPTAGEQWRITSNMDGYFQIASRKSGSGNTKHVLKAFRGSSASAEIIVQSALLGSAEQEWNIVSAGNGYFNIVNRLSGLALAISEKSADHAGSAVQESRNASAKTQQWRIVPVR
jgi:hypothetical protein